MAKRERQNELKIYLSDNEQYILEQKWKASNMKSKSAFIRHLILYGYVYDVNYEHLREYNTILSRIGNNLNQIAKRMNATGNVYEADVREVKELMKQVWQSQKSMLSKQPSIKQQITSVTLQKQMKASSFLPLDAVRKLLLLISSLPCQKPIRQTQTKPFI